MKIGDIVWRSNSGMGRIIDIRSSSAPYLVYFYKENNRLYNGNDRGPIVAIGGASEVHLLLSVQCLCAS